MDNAPGPQNALWRVPIGGGDPQLLLATEEPADFLSVHPDGRRIAFYTGSSDTTEVWVMQHFLPPVIAAG